MNFLRIISINIIVFFSCLLMVELLFGYWFDKNNLGAYMREHRMKKNSLTVKFKDENLDNLNNNNSEIIEFEEEDIFEDEVDFDDLFTDTSNVWFTDEKIDTIKEI